VVDQASVEDAGQEATVRPSAAVAAAVAAVEPQRCQISVVPPACYHCSVTLSADPWFPTALSFVTATLATFGSSLAARCGNLAGSPDGDNRRYLA
jgi:hypothetical protein